MSISYANESTKKGQALTVSKTSKFVILLTSIILLAALVVAWKASDPSEYLSKSEACYKGWNKSQLASIKAQKDDHQAMSDRAQEAPTIAALFFAAAEFVPSASEYPGFMRIDKKTTRKFLQHYLSSFDDTLKYRVEVKELFGDLLDDKPKSDSEIVSQASIVRYRNYQLDGFSSKMSILAKKNEDMVKQLSNEESQLQAAQDKLADPSTSAQDAWSIIDSSDVSEKCMPKGFKKSIVRWRL